MKIAVTILFIGVSLLVCALIAGVVREIVKRFKPVPPPQITSTLEFGSPDSMLTYEYPGDDKLQGVIDEFGKSGYTLTQIYGPSDSYPLQAIRLGFARADFPLTLPISFPQALSAKSMSSAFALKFLAALILSPLVSVPCPDPSCLKANN